MALIESLNCTSSVTPQSHPFTLFADEIHLQKQFRNFIHMRENKHEKERRDALIDATRLHI